MTASAYSRIFIIYNPNSTSGRAEQKAKRLAAKLKKHSRNNVVIVPTEHAGHAETLAHEAASKYEQPLIISVSGDGGYNEVINGVMRAQVEGSARRPVCAILAAGNANDYRRTTRQRKLFDAIEQQQPEHVDVLRLSATNSKNKITRYAHSYIGFGITSKVAIELNRERLSRAKEVKIVLRSILNFRGFTIEDTEGNRRHLNSLVFANINQMAKVFKLGGQTDLHDGLFRVVAIPRLNPLRLLVTYVSIALRGFKAPPQQKAYKFKLTDAQAAHTDGEVIDIPSGAIIEVKAIKEALRVVR